MKISIKMTYKALCLVFTNFALAFSVTAQTIPQEQHRSAFRLNVGYHSKYMRTEFAYETPSLFQTTFLGQPFDIKLEMSLAYWHTNHTPVTYNSRSSLWQLGITPMMRWWINDNWYLEGGIGATFMSHTRFADKELSTSFQFGDHLGIVRTFSDDWRIGLRLSHFSNASIKRPNPGLNIIQLTASRSF